MIPNALFAQETTADIAGTIGSKEGPIPGASGEIIPVPFRVGRDRWVSSTCLINKSQKTEVININNSIFIVNKKRRFPSSGNRLFFDVQEINFLP
jgi:hypothetical protein